MTGRPLGDPANEFVTFANPCAVKGISIFLALADAFPATQFAAVPTWGTNAQDRAALHARPNLHMLDPVDNIEHLMQRTRVLLVPSLWAEARSRIIVEAMLCGVPVMASDIGGIPEAKMGVPYLLPVNPITKYRQALDEQMVPVAEVPPQDAAPWRDALARLLNDPGPLPRGLRVFAGGGVEVFGKSECGGLRAAAVRPWPAPWRSRLCAGPSYGAATVRERAGFPLARKAPPARLAPSPEGSGGRMVPWPRHLAGATFVLFPARRRRRVRLPVSLARPVVRLPRSPART